MPRQAAPSTSCDGVVLRAPAGRWPASTARRPAAVPISADGEQLAFGSRTARCRRRSTSRDQLGARPAATCSTRARTAGSLSRSDSKTSRNAPSRRRVDEVEVGLRASPCTRCLLSVVASSAARTASTSAVGALRRAAPGRGRACRGSAGRAPAWRRRPARRCRPSRRRGSPGRRRPPGPRRAAARGGPSAAAARRAPRPARRTRRRGSRAGHRLHSVLAGRHRGSQPRRAGPSSSAPANRSPSASTRSSTSGAVNDRCPPGHASTSSQVERGGHGRPRPGAQRVRRDGRLRAVVLLQSTKHLPGRSDLVIRRHDQVRMRALEPLRPPCAYSRALGGHRPAIGAYTCMPLEPAVLANGVRPSSTSRRAAAPRPRSTRRRRRRARVEVEARAGRCAAWRPAAAPATAGRAAPGRPGWPPRPASAGPRRGRSRWSRGSCPSPGAGRVTAAHPVGACRGRVLLEEVLPVDAVGPAGDVIGRSATWGSSTGATRV